ncbi:GINS complex subunit [Lodderomyces elongisporus]|uniref:GINS complex subunit n=1 Tax=Lodderomyces elongisporus TaxID=36914 RepID=UPI0029227B02|nr:GINS complex subunit [Lodderomyces elongisporus]WLF78617.1 GINS complex subunit [Lodderomyces elongisporus]
MDIDDILREFEESSNAKKLNSENICNSLIQAMMNERMAPELLPYKSNLMSSILTHISNQQQFLLDSHEYGDMNSGNGIISDDFKLRLMIIETDVERISYIVRLYLRTRLTKLNKFTIYYVNASHNETENGESQELLSLEEREYIHKYLHLLTQLYNNCFLKKLPKFLTLLDENVGGQNMTIEPDLDQLVFVKCVSETPITLRIEDDEIDMEKNGVYVVKYNLIKRYLDTEDIILI